MPKASSPWSLRGRFQIGAVDGQHLRQKDDRLAEPPRLRMGQMERDRRGESAVPADPYWSGFAWGYSRRGNDEEQAFRLWEQRYGQVGAAPPSPPVDVHVQIQESLPASTRADGKVPWTDAERSRLGDMVKKLGMIHACREFSRITGRSEQGCMYQCTKHRLGR